MKRWAVAVAAAAGAAAVAGNFHFVRGSSVDGVRVMPKVSWSLNETFINLDEVSQMPLIFVRAQYPLFLATLEKRREASTQAGLTERNVARVLVGMTRNEVHQILGSPSTEGFESLGERRDYWSDPVSGRRLTLHFSHDRLERIEHR